MEPHFALRTRARIEVLGKLEADGLALTHARLDVVGRTQERLKVIGTRHDRLPPAARRQLAHRARQPDDPGVMPRHRPGAGARLRVEVVDAGRAALAGREPLGAAPRRGSSPGGALSRSSRGPGSSASSSRAGPLEAVHLGRVRARDAGRPELVELVSRQREDDAPEARAGDRPAAHRTRLAARVHRRRRARRPRPARAPPSGRA